jgi:hypothetical protein
VQQTIQVEQLLRQQQQVIKMYEHPDWTCVLLLRIANLMQPVKGELLLRTAVW